MLKLWESGQEQAWLKSFQVRTPIRPWYDEVDSLGHVSNIQFPR